MRPEGRGKKAGVGKERSTLTANCWRLTAASEASLKRHLGVPRGVAGRGRPSTSAGFVLDPGGEGQKKARRKPKHAAEREREKAEVGEKGGNAEGTRG